MSTIKQTGFSKLIFVSVVAAAMAVNGIAQTAAPAPAPTPQPRKIVVPTPKVVVSAPAATSVIVENKPPAPQVVTILHRLSGLKVLNWLMSKEDIEEIAKIDRNFNLAGEVHTNVIAGVALDDGRIIAAWLPEAEAEFPIPRAWVQVAPNVHVGQHGVTPATPPAPPAPPVNQTPPALPRMPAMPDLPGIMLPMEMLQSADLKVITSDGKRIVGRYIGLDGLTGLSLIALSNGNVSQNSDDKNETIVVGQRLRLIGPQRVMGAEQGPRSPVYIRIGETEAIVASLVRSPSGGLAKVKVRSAKFTPANIGAVAINDANETLGIVDGVRGSEATIVPLNLVRMAAKRVVARQASVPRPWLGIRGEPVTKIALDQIVRTGWEIEKARALADQQQGIMLTFVAPGSPAALAKLKVGDVILSVNNGFIRDAQEFSFQLDEATPDRPVRFTVARPDKAVAEALEIRLSEAPDLFPWRTVVRDQRNVVRDERKIVRTQRLRVDGIETVALRPDAAGHFGSSGGLLVVSVEPSTDAFKAGLRPGDVIEVINGQPVYSSRNRITVSLTPGATTTCTVVRNKEKKTFSFKYELEKEKEQKEKVKEDKQRKAENDDDEDKP